MGQSSGRCVEQWTGLLDTRVHVHPACTCSRLDARVHVQPAPRGALDRLLPVKSST